MCGFRMSRQIEWGKKFVVILVDDPKKKKNKRSLFLVLLVRQVRLTVPGRRAPPERVPRAAWPP